MSKWIVFIACALVGPFNLSYASSEICWDDRPANEGLHGTVHEDPREDKGYKQRVELNYSDSRTGEYQDPRDDYEWPGANDDSFYNFFTR